MSDQDDDLPPPAAPDSPAAPPAAQAPANPPTTPNNAPPQATAPAADGSDGTDLERDVDNAIGAVERRIDRADSASKNLGEGKQDLERGKEELQDGDQDTADKAANAAGRGADATRNVDQALKDLGILDQNDSTLTDVADGIEDFAEDIFGKKPPPDSLPPVRYRVFFGKKDDLMSGLSQMGQGLLDDALQAGDSLLERGAAAIGASDYLGTDPFSSVMEKHSPFAEDPAELDREESVWRVASCKVDEGLNVVWRAELVLVTNELVDPALETDLDAESAAGGLLDQIAGPIKSAVGAIDTVRDIVDGDDGGDQDAIRDSEVALAAREAELREEQERRDQLQQLLDEANERGAPAAEIADLTSRLAAAQQDVASKTAEVNAARQDLAGRRTRNRKKKSGAAAVAERITGITDAVGRLGSDPLGALSDIVGGADRKGGWPDGPVYRNVPLDPADFLGQTLSLRVSREFQTNPPANRPRDVAGHAWTARYVTGVVVEMQDLGVRTPFATNPRAPAPAPTAPGQRWIRLVIQPELAKLALRRDHRAFNRMSALEIVREVFRSAGVYGFLPDLPGVGVATDWASGLVEKIPFVGGAMSDAISGQFIRTIPPPGNLGPITEDEWTPKREMCVQYGETDLDFVRRLLEEEGIHFAFEHRRGFERIVLLHDPFELEQATTIDGRPVPYQWSHWYTQPKLETIGAIAERRRLRPGKVTLRDFTFSKSDQTATPRESTDDSSQPEARLPYGERYEYPGRFPFQYIGDGAIHYRDYTDPADRDYARLRLEEEAARARRVTLKSNVIAVSSCTTLRTRGGLFQRDGKTVDLTDETPRADLLVIERVRWSGGNPGLVPPIDPASADYDSELSGYWIDLDDRRRTPVRPARTIAKPRITSLQTATVVDHDGDHDEDEAIHVDHATLRRVLVRFHWDRRGELPLGLALPLVGRGTSCWCRVAQPWAGDDFGVLFVPRIGSEVVVAFENGDPDRPYVIGSLYDGEHPMPAPGRETAREGFTPPEANPTQLSTIMTRTSPWDEDEGVVHELTFDDTMSRERVLLKSGRHLVEEVRVDHATSVTGNQTNEVRRHHGEIIEKEQQLFVEGSRKKIVRKDQLVTIEGHRKTTVGDAHRVEVLHDHDERTKGVVELVYRASRTLTVHGERVTTVGEPDADPKHDLHEVAGTKTDVITGSLTVLAGALALGQPGGAAMAAPAAEIGAGPSEDGQSYTLNATADHAITLKAAREVRIVSVNGMVTLELGGDFEASVPGSRVGVAGSADGGVLFASDTKVEIQTEKGELAVAPAEARLRAKGGDEAIAAVTPAGVKLSGRTGVVKATTEIRSGMTKVGS